MLLLLQNAGSRRHLPSTAEGSSRDRRKTKIKWTKWPPTAYNIVLAQKPRKQVVACRDGFIGALSRHARGWGGGGILVFYIVACRDGFMPRLSRHATAPFSQNLNFSSGIFSRRCRLFVFNRFSLFLASFYPEHLQKPKDSIIYKNYIKTTQTDSIIIQNTRRK